MRCSLRLSLTVNTSNESLGNTKMALRILFVIQPIFDVRYELSLTIVNCPKTRRCHFICLKRDVFDALYTRRLPYQYLKSGIRCKIHFKVVIKLWKAIFFLDQTSRNAIIWGVNIKYRFIFYKNTPLWNNNVWAYGPNNGGS